MSAKPKLIYCKNCCHPVALDEPENYTMGLIKARVTFLQKLASHGGQGHKNELGLDGTELTNCHSLKHWKLTERIAKGTYKLTELGWKFVRGEIAIFYNCVRTKGTNNFNYLPPLVTIDDCTKEPSREEIIQHAKEFNVKNNEEAPQQAYLNLRGTLHGRYEDRY